MAKEKDDEYKVVTFKTLDNDDETQVATLPPSIHLVQGAQVSQRSVQSIRQIAGSWSSFGDDSAERDESEQIARLRNQLSAHHQEMSSAATTSLSSTSLASDRRMAIATTSTSQMQSSQMQSSQMQSSQMQSSQIHMQKQMQRISNFRQQTSNVRASVEKQEFTNLQSIDESKEISTSPIHLKVVTSRNRIQMHHVHSVQEFRSKM